MPKIGGRIRITRTDLANSKWAAGQEGVIDYGDGYIFIIYLDNGSSGVLYDGEFEVIKTPDDGPAS